MEKCSISPALPPLTRWVCGFVVVCSVLAALGQGADRQTLTGHLPAVVTRTQPLGRPDGAQRLNLAIGLPLRHREALTNLLQRIYDPAGPNYHHYLTPQEFAEQFGPTEADYQTVIAFAKANGLTVTATHPNRVVLDVSGSVTDIEKALHINLQVFQHPAEARTFYAPDTEPSLELSTPILRIDGLDNVSLPHPQYVIKPGVPRLAAKARPQAGSGPDGNYMGNDFRTTYAPGVTLTGAGQTVGLLQFDGYYANDILTYETQAGLPNVPLQNVLLDGASGLPDSYDDGVEVSLDIEMAISMAPAMTKVIIYEAPNPSPFVDLLNRMATDNLAKQLSCSWGGGTASPTAEQVFLQFAAQGQSFFNASGDSDAFDGMVDFPAEEINVTQAGGTTLATTGPGGSWLSETVWNLGGDVGSSGGISTSYPIPAWQLGISMTANQGSTTMRNIPDVAIVADDVYVIAEGGSSLTGVGGTSCAAPLWAGFMALVNQRAAANGRPPLGFLNPALYELGKSAGYSAAFHDITTGNNFNSGSPNRFSSVAGYDLCTGWGTPRGSALIDALAGPADALQILPGADFATSGGPGGPFTPSSQNYVLTNAGSASLNWALSNPAAWLNASASGGALAPGGSAATLTFSLNATASSLAPGTYAATVWFTNLSSGFAQSRTCALVVLGAPVLLSQPTNEMVLVGATAAFHVNALGAPPLAYSWSRNGALIPGATSPNYSLADAQLSDSGSQFSCLVSNYLGAASTTNARLMVLVRPPDYFTDFSAARMSTTWPITASCSPRMTARIYTRFADKRRPACRPIRPAARRFR